MKGKKPTLKQQLFARHYVKTGNATQAAMTAYDTKKRTTAKVMGARYLKLPVVQQEIKAILIKSGLTLEQGADYLHRVIEKGMEGKANASDSLRGLDMLFKLHNSYPASKSIKIAYTKNEQVASKDLQEVIDNLKVIAGKANSLLSATE